MSDALEQAKRATDDVSLTTSVRLPLSLLLALIVEIERLRDLQSGNRPGVNAVPEPEPVIVMKHKDIRG